jgi:phosphoribosylglycinamide formyltransferase-1
VATAVLCSGAGSNLRALLDAAERPRFPARIVLVIANRPSAPALAIARERGVEAVALPVSEFGGDAAARDLAMRDRLLAGGVRLVVCAGYDRVLDPALLEAFPDAILNLHPSLLPAFAGGMHAVADALEAGVKVSGCTVHLLAPGATDGGPIVLQAAVPVLEDDDVERLRVRIQEQEWRLLPEAVALWCEGRLRREGPRVRILPAFVPQSSPGGKAVIHQREFG